MKLIGLTIFHHSIEIVLIKVTSDLLLNCQVQCVFFSAYLLGPSVCESKKLLRGNIIMLEILVNISHFIVHIFNIIITLITSIGRIPK